MYCEVQGFKSMWTEICIRNFACDSTIVKGRRGGKPTCTPRVVTVRDTR